MLKNDKSNLYFHNSFFFPIFYTMVIFFLFNFKKQKPKFRNSKMDMLERNEKQDSITYNSVVSYTSAVHNIYRSITGKHKRIKAICIAFRQADR